jgi:hypothetical protein
MSGSNNQPISTPITGEVTRYEPKEIDARDLEIQVSKFNTEITRINGEINRINDRLERLERDSHDILNKIVNEDKIEILIQKSNRESTKHFILLVTPIIAIIGIVAPIIVNLIMK